MRLVIADDSVILREGLARLLREQGFEVVAQVGTAPELLPRLPASSRTSQSSTSGCRRRIRTRASSLRRSCGRGTRRSVCWCSLNTSRPSTHFACLSEASGRGLSPEGSRARHDRPRGRGARVGEGGSVTRPALVEQLVERPDTNGGLADLTQRERDVLTLMAEGLSDRGIAQRLVVTHKTVETHVRHIFSKLDLPRGFAENRRVHAVVAYLRER